MLPTFISRPDPSLPPSEPAPGPTYTSINLPLDSGVPFRIPLNQSRTVLLGVPLGQVRRWMGDDPSTVVVDGSLGSQPITPPGTSRDLDDVGPRLTLLDGSTVGDTVACVPGSPAILTVNGKAVVEVIVDGFTLTVGSLRSPGQYGSSIALRWRDLHPAANSGPPDALPDDTIPRHFYRQEMVL